MKKFLFILLGLFLLCSTIQAQRHDGRNRRERPGTHRIQHRPKYHPPLMPHKYKYYQPKPLKYNPKVTIPYKIRRYLYKHYSECVVIKYIGVYNPGYIDGHDRYYKVYLSNGVILIFSTKYNIIH